MFTVSVSDIQYPVLVYGTLRPGMSNYASFLDGVTIFEQDVQLDGFSMYSNGGFPYLVNGEHEVTATLVYIDPTQYSDVLRGLDYLEGYDDKRLNNHYDRVLHRFMADGVERVAWIYVCGSSLADQVVAELTHICSGDWIEFESERGNFPYFRPVEELG